jgi:copper chaperone CopZ
MRAARDYHRGVAAVREILRVENVMCQRCVASIAAALAPIDGLLGASANLIGEVTVAYDEKPVGAAVVAALEAAGFPVSSRHAAP